MTLKDRIIRDILEFGPMSVAQYMSVCLFDPKDGYYTRNVDFVRDGDFLTAPRISQLFGESLGLWVYMSLCNLKAQKPVLVLEIGAGDGTLLADVSKTLNRLEPDSTRYTLGFIEASPRLAQMVLNKNPNAIKLNNVSEIDSQTPVIIIANELLDCMGSRQFVKTKDNVIFERVIGCDNKKNLCFGLIPTQDLDANTNDLSKSLWGIGQIYEHAQGQFHFMETVCDTLKAHQGCALFIDYGYEQTAFGDTLQAMRDHVKKDPLSDPGLDDLTQWVDFLGLKRLIDTKKSVRAQIVTQAQFLKTMGIDARYQALCNKNPDQALSLMRQFNRLTQSEQMGTLFKALVINSQDTAPIES